MTNDRRLDRVLVECGLASGREKAKELILAGRITVNGKSVKKVAFSVKDGDKVECLDEPSVYVGRGALKLEKALSAVQIPIEGKVAMDIGASTGGFTQVLLMHGAAHVYAVDVGHGQLHPSLKADARVTDLEGTDVRDERLKETVFPASVDLLTMDVSFISVRMVLDAVFSFLKPSARLILLIKPQFEAGIADVGKNGIVKDKKVHVRVLRELCAFFEERACRIEWIGASPITGGAGKRQGNIEYLTVLTREETATGITPDIRRLVEETFFDLSEAEEKTL